MSKIYKKKSPLNRNEHDVSKHSENWKSHISGVQENIVPI
jgi:hypothetical protein